MAMHSLHRSLYMRVSLWQALNSEARIPKPRPLTPPVNLYSYWLTSMSRKVLSDKDSVCNLVDGDLSSTESSSLPKLSFWHSLWKINPYPNNPRLTLSITVDVYFIIASFVCLSAFLVYIFPLPSLDIFSPSQIICWVRGLLRSLRRFRRK